MKKVNTRPKQQHNPNRNLHHQLEIDNNPVFQACPQVPKTTQNSNIIKPSYVKALFIETKSKLDLSRTKSTQTLSRLFSELEKEIPLNDQLLLRKTMQSILKEDNKRKLYQLLITTIDLLKPKSEAIIKEKTLPDDIKRDINTLIYAMVMMDLEQLKPLCLCFEQIMGKNYTKSVASGKGVLMNEDVKQMVKVTIWSNEELDNKIQTYIKNKNAFVKNNLKHSKSDVKEDNINFNILNNNINNNNNNQIRHTKSTELGVSSSGRNINNSGGYTSTNNNTNNNHNSNNTNNNNNRSTINRQRTTVSTHNQQHSTTITSGPLNASQFRIVRNIDTEKNTLQSMGFDIEFISRIYMFLKPTSLNQAVEFMLQENGIYQHEFYANPRKISDLCFICQTPINCHINYKGGVLPQSQSQISSTLSLSTLKQSIITNHSCEICYETLKPQDIRKYRPPCKHVICKECIFHYIADKINEASVLDIRCFFYECTHVFTNEYIEYIISHDNALLTKYKAFKTKAQIQRDPNKKFCPFPNCEHYLQKDLKGNKYVMCKIGHKYCFECLQEWHGDNECIEIIDKDFQLWAKDKVIKRCPQCQFYIEKNEGCNHITCQQCGYEFCWLCLGEYISEQHFKEGKCRGLWFADINYIEEKNNLPFDPELEDYLYSDEDDSYDEEYENRGNGNNNYTAHVDMYLSNSRSNNNN